MGPSEDEDDNILKKYEELCLDLNMDKKSKEEAWRNYEKIKKNFTLEGDQNHWLACSLYEACRRSVVPTVGRGTVEGNCVSLTRLLRSSHFSLIQFFNKMKKWSDMACLSQEFRDKIDKLERNFAVSTVIFKKFEPIFLDIFKSPADVIPRQHRSRKHRKLPCSLADVFNFSWTMFVQVKGLPVGYQSKDWKPPAEPHCIIKHLCDKHEGLELEAKVIKEHWWKPYLKKLFEKKALKGKLETLSAVLEIGNFEANKKFINNSYEEYVLTVGDFDERIFLDEDADEEIGTPARSCEDMTGELTEKMQQRTSLQQHFDETQSLAPSTPLTGRRYLKEKDPSVTPVSTATQSVSKLQHLLSGRKTSPSESLTELLLELGGQSLITTIAQRIQDMGEIFCNRYAQMSDNHPGSRKDFAKRRLQLGESLYFKSLESILQSEKKKAEYGRDLKINVLGLVNHDLFHRSLFACCLEIIIFSYNSQRMFPWIVEIFDLSPYHFYKVVEIMVREEDGLSRDVVKHLNHIEECILESLAWKSESPIWEAIKAQNNEVPLSAQVSLPVPVLADQSYSKASLRRLVLDRKTQSVVKDPLQSPTAPSASDRFSSPSPGSSSPSMAKRRLFALDSSAGVSANKSPQVVSDAAGATKRVPIATVFTQKPTQHLVAFQQVMTQDGRQVLIPVQTQVLTPQTSVLVETAKCNTLPVIHTPGHAQLPKVQTQQQITDNTEPTQSLVQLQSLIQPAQQQQRHQLKGGSLALFFRKVYHLAHVRLRDLCQRLEITNEDLHLKMWTCVEQVIVHHTELLKDRHLDQMIMCSVYVIAKVYRSILLNNRGRHTSGSSDDSRTEASGSSSPVISEMDEGKEKKNMQMRSTSTLPIPHPSSHPPTPTKLVSSGSGFESEERVDLIQFFNQVFITQLRNFALRFSSNATSDMPLLSPLPPSRFHSTSPRRVSSKHSVYISPHKLQSSPRVSENMMLYCFDRSPSKHLRAINKMIQLNNADSTGKRTLQIDASEEPEVPAKRSYFRRLQDVKSDRQEQAKVVIVK